MSDNATPFSVRLSKDLHAQLKLVAVSEGKPVAEMVRIAIAELVSSRDFDTLATEHEATTEALELVLDGFESSERRHLVEHVLSHLDPASVNEGEEGTV